MNHFLISLSINNYYLNSPINNKILNLKLFYYFKNIYLKNFITNFIFFDSQINFLIYKSKFNSFLNRIIKISNNNLLCDSYSLKNINNISIIYCNFLNFNNFKEDIGGSSIYMNNISGILNINNCNFINCSSMKFFSKGGAILIQNGNCSINLKNNCFFQCSSYMSGSSFHILSLGYNISLNDTTILNCPFIKNKLQISTAYLRCNFEVNNFNNSLLNSFSSSGFFFAGNYKTISKYLNLFNCTTNGESALYEYNVYGLEFNAFIDSMNIICFPSKMNYIAMVSIRILYQDKVIFIGNNKDYIFSIRYGQLILRNCLSDKNISGNFKTLDSNFLLINCKLYQKLKKNLIKIIFNNCNNNILNFNKFNLFKLPLIIIFSGIFVSIFFFFLFNFIIKKKEIYYQEISIPKILSK